MSETPKTETVLRQFLAGIAEAARPWTLDEACEEALRREHAVPFQDAVDAGYWPAAEQKMMRIAAYVGSLAAMLSESRDLKGEPGDLDLDALLRASGVVQALVCPSGGPTPMVGPRPVAAGRFCQIGQFGSGLDISEARKILTGR